MNAVQNRFKQVHPPRGGSAAAKEASEGAL